MPEEPMKGSGLRFTFGEMADYIAARVEPTPDDGETYVGLEHLDSGSLTVRRWGADVALIGTKFRMRKGDILFARRNAYLRRVALAPHDGIFSAHGMVLRARPHVVVPEFLPFFMQSDLFMDRAEQISVGSLSPTINWGALKEQEFALPPLEEQRSLVGMLTTADEVSDSLLSLLDSQRIAETALFEQLLSRNNSTIASLGTLLTEPPRNGCSAPEKDEETGHWVLSLSAIGKWGYRSGELKAVEKTPEMVTAILRKGDLVISRSNTLELVGLPAVFDEDRTDVSRPDTMMRLQPDESRLRKRFLELYLRSPAGRRQVQSYAAGTSASMKKINGTNVAKLQVPLPDVNVQIHIENMTELIRQGRESLNARLKRSQELRMALLNEAISVGGGALK